MRLTEDMLLIPGPKKNILFVLVPALLIIMFVVFTLYAIAGPFATHRGYTIYSAYYGQYSTSGSIEQGEVRVDEIISGLDDLKASNCKEAQQINNIHSWYFADSWKFNNHIFIAQTADVADAMQKLFPNCVQP